MSDSHRIVEPMISAALREQPDSVVYCGDGINDFKKFRTQFPELESYAVRGNCDFKSKEFPDTLTVDLAGVRVFITHGHLYRAKFYTDPVIYAAEEAGAQLLLFGHTHIPWHAVVRNVRILNPGSINDGKYGIVEIDGGKITAYNRRLNR